METPLDVLSTLAASMVETKEKTGDSVLGSSSCPPGLDTSTSYDLAAAAAAAAAAVAASPGSKELPTRALKADRLKERQELAQVLHLDKDHAASLCAARKTVSTASTQTQFSSFNGEAPPYPGPPPGPPPAYFAPRADDHSGDSYSHHPLYGPPPPLPPVPHSSPMSSSSPTNSSHLVDLSHSHAASSSDVQNAPLNLSLSSSPLPPVSLSSVSSSSAAAWQSHRTSVITCKSSSSSPVSNGGSSPHNGHGGNKGPASPSGNSHSASAVSDPAIEEHFRRSLAGYGESAPKTTASSSTAVESNVSITGSVDDHFAKALGDSTWKALKSQSDATPEIFPGSVDDHFAKALGATTWRRIKAETEHSESSSTGSTAGVNKVFTVTTPSNIPTTTHSPGHSSSSSPSNSSSSLSAPLVT